MGSESGDLIYDAARRAAAYLATPAGRVFPSPDSVEGLAAFSHELSADGRDPSEVLDELDRLGSPAAVRSTGGRYFGFVTGGVEPVAAAASVLATAWDQNVALPVMSPVGARLDAIATRWICQLLQLPENANAAFCSGASVANLTCILAARDALLQKEGWDVRAQGLMGAPPITVVTSEEAHVSALRALEVAGLGRNAVIRVPTDNAGRIEFGRLPKLGSRTLVVLQAGNVNTGHSDSFEEIIPLVREVGGWVHIDGAFGLWAAASPRFRHLVAGADQADSWATDAHKWLNAPYDSGIAICARESDLQRAVGVDAAYLATDGSDRVLMNLGLQMSQRARAVETWAILASRGQKGVAALVDQSCDLATQMSDALERAGAQVLAPVALNQVLVAFGDDATTEAVIAAVQQDGTCWAGGTMWKGRRAMRVSVSGASTTKQDIEIAAAAVLSCWARVRA